MGRTAKLSRLMHVWMSQNEVRPKLGLLVPCENHPVNGEIHMMRIGLSCTFTSIHSVFHSANIFLKQFCLKHKFIKSQIHEARLYIYIYI